jgi:hypothetical protein
MTPLVTIEDSTILTMIADSRFADTIPCLMNKAELFKKQATGCGACARKRQQKQRDEMAKIKSCLGALSSDKKIELKQLLGAQKIRITFARPGGEVVQLTF